MYNLIIKNATVICPKQGINKSSNIIIKNGKIEEITDIIKEDFSGFDVINAEGLIAAPGLVDMHVHLRDPGQTNKEDITSGCNAAAAGGVTSLLCMPNTNPVIDNTNTVKYVLEKSKNASAKVYVSGSISKKLESKESTDLKALKQAGIIAATDDGKPVENLDILKNAFKTANDEGIKIVAHCEDLALAANGIINKGKVSEKLKVEGIPREAEDKGTQLVINIAEQLDVPVHICHVSTEGSIEIIKKAKKKGIKVTAETAPHYFALTENELLKRDADYRMNPPLRTEQDRQAIINALIDNTIDAIATDHAPHDTEDKKDFASALNGAIGMETSLSAAVTYLVNSELLTIERVIEKMSFTPAKILGIEAGTLEKGKAADIVLFNMKENWQVNPNNLHGKSKNTPFKGLTLYGKVKFTILDGKIVYKDV